MLDSKNAINIGNPRVKSVVKTTQKEKPKGILMRKERQMGA
jgi:hypothetical protein